MDKTNLDVDETLKFIKDNAAEGVRPHDWSQTLFNKLDGLDLGSVREVHRSIVADSGCEDPELLCSDYGREIVAIILKKKIWYRILDLEKLYDTDKAGRKQAIRESLKFIKELNLDEISAITGPMKNRKPESEFQEMMQSAIRFRGFLLRV